MKIIKSPYDKRTYTFIKFDNGLECLYIHDSGINNKNMNRFKLKNIFLNCIFLKETEKSACCLDVLVGSLDEPQD